MLRALATPSADGVRCVIGGDGEDRPRLTQLARDLGVEDRVTFTGQLDEAGLLEHLAQCRAVIFPPADEDYGFVTVEAFASSKAVITCSDSGGPLEFIRDGQNGLVVAATPEALGDAFARIEADQGLAERMGARAKAHAPMNWRTPSHGWSSATRGASAPAFGWRCIPCGRRCSSLKYSQYAHSSPCLAGAPPARCSPHWHHGR